MTSTAGVARGSDGAFAAGGARQAEDGAALPCGHLEAARKRIGRRMAESLCKSRARPALFAW
jgi:hypothetical protein